MSEEGAADQPARVLEYSKSSRAKCKGACKEAIPAGVLRFGTLAVIDERTSYSWRCIPCITQRVASNLQEKGGDVRSFVHFVEIEEGIQDAFCAYIKALAEGNDASEHLAALNASKKEAPGKGAKKEKKEKAKRTVEEILGDVGEEDSRDFSSLTLDELKELLRAKKAKLGGKKDELVERVTELYGGGGAQGKEEDE